MAAATRASGDLGPRQYMGNWLLPEGLADILPAEARRMEELRRRLLDLYRTYGYELVAPPLVEYIDSLLSGTGTDLNLHTCKLVDQLSGRTLGVRADMTPQVTRIDAHLLNRAGVTRLCYCGPVLHARPAGLLSGRELLQIGAELYGHQGFEADVEIVCLALETVRAASVAQPRLDLCHPGLVRAIIDADPAAAGQADDIVARARKAAEAAIAEATEEGKAKREELVAAARKDIEAETRRSIEQLRKEVADLTVLATEKVTRKSLSDADHQRLIEEALAEVDFSALVGDAAEGNGGTQN